jgi:hypothetical protein
LAGLIVCLAPALARAESVVFRNEGRAPVWVQTARLVGGRHYRDKAHLLRHGEATPRIPMSGELLITVYDGKVTNRVLFQRTLRATGRPHAYGIVPAGPLKVRMVSRPPGSIKPAPGRRHR